MHRVLLDRRPKTVGEKIPLNDFEGHHVKTVLRLRINDPLDAIDGAGTYAKGRYIHMGKGCGIEIDSIERSPESHPQALESPAKITLFMCIIKQDRFEWVLEKATELGVHTIQPVLSAYTIVKVKEKGPGFFKDKWQRISDQSLKQCGRTYRMHILEPKPLYEAIDTPAFSSTQQPELRADFPSIEIPPFLFCNERAKSLPGFQIPYSVTDQKNPIQRILVGPEGGFNDEEIRYLSSHKSARPISLGHLILRAETAAIASVVLLSSLLASQSNPKIGSQCD